MKLVNLNPDENGIVPWKEVKEQLGDFFPQFQKFLHGQTVTEKGPFLWDIERFVRGLPVLD